MRETIVAIPPKARCFLLPATFQTTRVDRIVMRPGLHHNERTLIRMPVDYFATMPVDKEMVGVPLYWSWDDTVNNPINIWPRPPGPMVFELKKYGPIAYKVFKLVRDIGFIAP